MAFNSNLTLGFELELKLAILASVQGHDGGLSPRCSSSCSETYSSEDLLVFGLVEGDDGKGSPHCGASWAETGSTEDVEAVAATSSDSDTPAVDIDTEQLPVDVSAWGLVGSRITQAIHQCPEEDEHHDPAAWQMVGARVFGSLMNAFNDDNE